MTRGGAVYIMASKRNGTLYTGVTSNLQKRVYEHKTSRYPNSFTSRYGCDLLVWYNGFHAIEDAIAEEKRLKGGNRKSKLKLIEAMNANWIDLYHDL
ncbi:GIY-YIG nuclease family protein [Crocinitomix catalasitica]|nr:GIY-YIG nuclease family protein [Crocinitomix catalasitica]